MEHACIGLSITPTLRYSSAKDRLRNVPCASMSFHEAKLELVVVDRISFGSRGFPDLPVLHAVSSDTRFSVGEFPTVRRRRCPLARGSRPGIREAEALSREDIRLHPGNTRLAGLLSIRLPYLF